MLPILTELRHALDMQMELGIHVEEGNFFKVRFSIFILLSVTVPLNLYIHIYVFAGFIASYS